jgi:hypothetical protein
MNLDLKDTGEHFFWENSRLIHRISNFLEKNSMDELHIWGEAGVGKTSLIEHSLKGYREQSHCFSYKFYAGDHDCRIFYQKFILGLLNNCDISEELSEEMFIRLLCYEFKFDDRDILYLRQIYNKNYSELLSHNLGLMIIDILMHYKTDLIIFLDDVQWAPPKVTDFIEDIRAIDTQKKIKIILSSRLPNIRKSLFNFNKMLLEPLEYQAFSNFVTSYLGIDIKPQYISDFYKKSQGNFFITKIILKIIKNDYCARGKNIDKKNQYLIDMSMISDRLNEIILLSINDLSSIEKEALKIIACSLVPIKADMLLFFLFKNPKTIISSLLKAGFLKGDEGNTYSISHDLYRELISSSIDAHERNKIYLSLVKYINLQRFDDINKVHLLSEYAWFSGDIKLSYKYNLLGAKAALRSFSPSLAIFYIERLQSILDNFKINIRRRIILLVMSCNAHIMLGSNALIKDNIVELENSLMIIDVNPKLKYEICNILSLFYWSYGGLQKSMSVIDNFIGNVNIIAAEFVPPIFFGRYVGVLSDLGKFEESNNLINEYVKRKLYYKSSNSFAQHYQMETVLLSIQARNYSYLNRKLKFKQCSNIVLKTLKNDFSVSEIIILCFLAEGYLEINDFEMARNLALRGIKCVKKNNLTILNTFLFAILGYAESMLGNISGLHKIKSSIEAAELEERWSRVSLYYYYYAMALKKIIPHHSIKRLVSKGIKLARRNSEGWIEKKLISLK